MEHLITAMRFANGRRLRLQYGDGSVYEKDFAELIELGGVFARLADESYWRRCMVEDGGRALAWPTVNGDPITALDLCADALWFEAHPAEYAKYLSSLGEPSKAA